MNKDTILILSNKLGFGGAEIYTVTIANRLAESGYNVILASAGGALVDRLNPNVEHYHVDLTAKKLGPILKCAKIINAVIRHKKVSLVHTNSVITCLIAKLATLTHTVPIVNTCHSWGTNKGKVQAKIVDLCANKVIAVSKSTAENYIVHGLSANKVEVIHNGIDTDKFRILSDEHNIETRLELGLQTDDFVILNVARMEETRKGHNTLLKAIKKVIAVHSNVKLVLVGDGILRKSYIKMVKDFGIENNVLFLKNRLDIPELMSMADMFCLPSDWEGLPLVIAEAMACGLPVVACDVSGVPEIVKDTITGFLVPMKSPDILTEKIIAIIENKEIQSSMRKAALSRVRRKFSEKYMINKVKEIYNLLLACKE